MIDTFDRRKQALVKDAGRRWKHAVRRLEACRKELELCMQWESVYHEGVLLKSNLYRVKRGMAQISVSDWLADGAERIIGLDPLLQPADQVDRIFRLSKKRKAAIPHLERQIDQRQRACAELQAAFESLQAVEDEGALEAWIAQHVKEKPTRTKKQKDEAAPPYHEFYTAAGLAVRVGKGAKSNDLLTFRYSKGSDWWFHVRDYPGSHVVLCVAKGQEPDAESVQDALHLALAYSKASGEREADIVATQCKQVSRFRDGPPGKVQLGKHKVMMVKHNADRLKEIKKRHA